MTEELIPEFPEAMYAAPLTSQGSDDALVAAITRLAHAVEQNTQALLGQRVPAAVTITTPPAAPVLTALPPVQGGQAPVMVDGCPIHHTPWKVVPAGISKKTGKAYDAFRACSTPGCDQRPKL
jgi:hypothetical protein